MNRPKVGSPAWVWKFSACEKKKMYATEKLAGQMAMRQSKLSGETIRPYKCPFSDHWHIGHSSSTISSGPKIYCGQCDKKILQSSWDKHYKLCAGDDRRQPLTETA